MIVDAIFGLLQAAVSGALSIFPHFTLPAWLASGPTCPYGGTPTVGCYASNIGQRLYWAHGWIPIDQMFTVAQGVLACIGVAIGIRLMRVGVSLITGGGGSAS